VESEQENSCSERQFFKFLPGTSRNNQNDILYVFLNFKVYFKIIIYFRYKFYNLCCVIINGLKLSSGIYNLNIISNHTMQNITNNLSYVHGFILIHNIIGLKLFLKLLH